MDDLISRKALLAEYDRVHNGPPGGARKLIEDAPAVQQWISVKDRLPENKGNYLGFTGSTTMVGYYKGNGIWWVWLNDVEGENLFTHWMPLPQQPKGE